MIKLVSYKDKVGNVKTQLMVLEDGKRIEIRDLDIEEDEIVRIGDKCYTLELNDWFHGKKEDGIDMFEYILVEEESAVEKDVTDFLPDCSTRINSVGSEG